jgi:hypothetical protein
LILKAGKGCKRFCFGDWNAQPELVGVGRSVFCLPPTFCARALRRGTCALFTGLW